jgi:8-oxo-dGTP diphosphatase
MDPQRPAGYDPSDFPPFAVTVDVVVMTVAEDALRLALIRRGGEPYAGWWALPGGFKRPDETLDEAVARELGEEAGMQLPRLAQFRSYGDPGRDPRMDVVTVGYYAVVPEERPLTAGTDAAAARWVDVTEVLDGTLPLAFDHARIVADARDRLADDLERSDAVLGLLGDEFTLSTLRRTYEAVWRLDLPAGPERDAFTLDRRNFRRQLMNEPGPFVEPTGRSTSDLPDSSVPGRPAAFHRATPAWRDASPVRRPRGLSGLGLSGLSGGSSPSAR